MHHIGDFFNQREGIYWLAAVRSWETLLNEWDESDDFTNMLPTIAFPLSGLLSCIDVSSLPSPTSVSFAPHADTHVVVI